MIFFLKINTTSKLSFSRHSATLGYNTSIGTHYVLSYGYFIVKLLLFYDVKSVTKIVPSALGLKFTSIAHFVVVCEVT